MTIREALDCLDDYCDGLETLLQKRQAAGGSKAQKGEKTEGLIEKVRRVTN